MKEDIAVVSAEGRDAELWFFAAIFYGVADYLAEEEMQSSPVRVNGIIRQAGVNLEILFIQKRLIIFQYMFDASADTDLLKQIILSCTL